MAHCRDQFIDISVVRRLYGLVILPIQPSMGVFIPRKSRRSHIFFPFLYFRSRSFCTFYSLFPPSSILSLPSSAWHHFCSRMKARLGILGVVANYLVIVANHRTFRSQSTQSSTATGSTVNGSTLCVLSVTYEKLAMSTLSVFVPLLWHLNKVMETLGLTQGGLCNFGQTDILYGCCFQEAGTTDDQATILDRQWAVRSQIGPQTLVR